MSWPIHVEARHVVLQDVLPLADLATDEALPELPGVPLDGLDQGLHLWGQAR